ncbi:hypothetical protein EFA69_11440 [Rufibacter immobilis]|uniref:Uncharacterized protein n=1 Tax=Rufibacter immobilis TaxID=1348778 RepID=A0A3M9MX50_9BACT|nr:hypothetical protein EFA69_11440 [Rufibacter immobilis]
MVLYRKLCLPKVSLKQIPEKEPLNAFVRLYGVDEAFALFLVCQGFTLKVVLKQMSTEEQNEFKQSTGWGSGLKSMMG